MIESNPPCTCKCHVSSNACCGQCSTYALPMDDIPQFLQTEDSPLEKRVIQLEETDKTRCKAITEIAKRLKSLEENTYKKPELSFSYKGVNIFFESLLQPVWDEINKLKEWKAAAIEKNIQDVKRIRELEKTTDKVQKIINENPGLIERIRILGTALHELSEENHKLRQIPHKCPICEGSGMKNISVEAALKVLDKHKDNSSDIFLCRACEGKGIVWD